MNQEIELKIQSWIDGELSATDAKNITAMVSTEPKLADLATELRLMKSALSGNELELKVPETREFYWSKISREIERQERQPAKPAAVPFIVQLRRFFMPLAGVTAVVAALVLTVNPTPMASDSNSASPEMQTMTFRDQASGMTVVWLQDRDDAASVDDSSKVETP